LRKGGDEAVQRTIAFLDRSRFCRCACEAMTPAGGRHPASSPAYVRRPNFHQMPQIVRKVTAVMPMTSAIPIDSSRAAGTFIRTMGITLAVTNRLTSTISTILQAIPDLRAQVVESRQRFGRETGRWSVARQAFLSPTQLIHHANAPIARTS